MFKSLFAFAFEAGYDRFIVNHYDKSQDIMAQSSWLWGGSLTLNRVLSLVKLAANNLLWKIKMIRRT